MPALPRSAFEEPPLPQPPALLCLCGERAVQAALVVRSQGRASISDRPLQELHTPYPMAWLWEGALLSLKERISGAT